MALAPGSRLGAYEILGTLGAGGMGEVYRARDPRLGREVAVKVLPDELSRDPDRLARFEREARILASLSHPNLAVVHGFERQDDVAFLVMELVPGETLRERLERGALGVEEALPLFRQIAEGLAAAHDRGITHRDLKPANVKITPDDKVKVLDFGLAKPTGPEDASGASLSLSPTLTAAATQRGEILGTAAYMSPEQARGKAVDRRTDVWAFGCVLFEALSGRQAFGGETITDILAAVVRADPEWDALPVDLPRAVRRLVRRCLEKDPDLRLRDLGDARLEIDDAIAGVPEERPEAAVMPAAAARRPIVPWLVAGVTTVLLAVALVLLWQRGAPVERPVRRFAVPLTEELDLGPNESLGVAIAPGGQRLALVISDDGIPRIVVRDLDQMNGRVLPGTDGAQSPFFSPDGEWIGFLAGGKLKKIAVAGGPALTLADAGIDTRGAGWAPDGSIVYAPTTSSPLMRIPAAGGEPEALTTLVKEEGERTHRWPTITPDGQWALFTVGTLDSPEYYEDSRIDAVSLASGERRTVMTGASMARAAASGHLVYSREGNLFAVPCDLSAMRPTGSPVLVEEGVYSALQSGAANFDLSREGTLVFLPGLPTSPDNRLVWVGRDGAVEPTLLPSGPYSQPALSPDGRKAALVRIGGKSNDIWVHDLERGGVSRLTFEGSNVNPVWTPDGGRVAFASARESGGMAVYAKVADGSASEEPIWDRDTSVVPNSWSPDGKLLAVDVLAESGLADIWIVPVEGGQDPYPFVEGRFDESRATFSPDGRWLAYSSDETGRYEVYVRPFPGPGGRWQISTNGGDEPRWSADGKELFFLETNRMYRAPVETTETLHPGTPELLFEGRFVRETWDVSYAVTPDGQRFLMVQPGQGGTRPDRILVTLNWLEELRRRVPRP